MTEDTNRRNVLKAIGASTTAATVGTMGGAAQTTTDEPIHDRTIDHDLEVVNRVDDELELSIEASHPEVSGSIEHTVTVQSPRGEGSMQHRWEIDALDVPGGEIEVSISTSDGRSDSATIPFADVSQRDYEAVSIALRDDRIMIGRIQV
ncbi:hypothetical protein [Halorussus lipolyticus]|uniref:hypothetical protein n=1 Tax=Halorussus lipolyticus TaxID=3034024 RepID=UPI0023E865F1|nr:hypothetical protein [Halorussus sp. DT80]